MDINLKLKDPWEMTHLEFVDDIIAFIKSKITAHHILQKKNFFPFAIKPKEYMYIIENDDDGTVGLLDLNRKMRRKGKTVAYYKEFQSQDSFDSWMEDEFTEWIEYCKSIGAYDQ